MNMFPEKKVCVECGLPFETTCDADTCTQCLIKPRKRDENPPPAIAAESSPSTAKLIRIKKPFNSPLKKERIMEPENDIIQKFITKKTKICVACKSQFSPTGNRQIRCKSCAESIVYPSREGKINKKKERPLNPSRLPEATKALQLPDERSQAIKLAASGYSLQTAIMEFMDFLGCNDVSLSLSGFKILIQKLDQ